MNVAATSTRRLPPKSQTHGFEPIENFRVNLRRLAWRLAELHRVSGAPAVWPFEGPTPIGPDERQALLDLAFDHLKRHDLGVAPSVPQCSDLFARPCKALGAAQVVLSLVWAHGDKEAAEPARRLEVSARRVQNALSSFERDLAIYLRVRAASHAANPWACVESHAVYCEMPARVPAIAEPLWAAIELLRSNALRPQRPEFARSGERLGLLKEAESILFSNGWTPDEIITVLDDGNGRDARERKDRLRKRLSFAKGVRVAQRRERSG